MIHHFEGFWAGGLEFERVTQKEGKKNGLAVVFPSVFKLFKLRKGIDRNLFCLSALQNSGDLKKIGGKR